MGIPKRTAGPSLEPITLADAKSHLKVDVTDDDSYITSLITVARTTAEQRTARTFNTSTWVYTLDSFPDAIQVPRPNLLTVTSLQYIDANGTLQTWNSTNYIVDTASEPGYVVPAYGVAWPATQARINTVILTYTAGYGPTAADVPLPLIHWMKLALTDMYLKRGLSSVGKLPVIPDKFVNSLLDPYCIESM